MRADPRSSHLRPGLDDHSPLLRARIPTRFVLLFVIVLGAESVYCMASLADYAGRVGLASKEIETIKSHPDYADEGVARIKRMLPVTEIVETNNRTINVDNAWLHQLLDDYKKASEPERRKGLEEAGGRLTALEEHLERLRAQADPQGNEEASRDKLREILARPEFSEKKKDPIAELINEVRRYIIELLASIWNRIRAGFSGHGSAVGTLLEIGVVLLLGAALLLALRMVLRLKPARKKVKEKVTVLGEEIEAGTRSSDLASAALAAAGAGDFRTGVRKLYIALLYELSERGLIELEPQATNREYLGKVSRFGRLVGPMSYLTEKFEYFWYGMFPSSSEDFSDYLEQYREAVGSAKSLSSE